VARRTGGRAGRGLTGRRPKATPEQIPPQTRVNITDPDSRSVKAQQGFLQGYNAQAAATSEQIIVAAELIGNANDYGMLEAVANPPSGNWPRRVSATRSMLCSLTRATGTVSRSRGSLPEACGHSCHPTPRTPNGAPERTAKGHAMTSCGGSSKATPGEPSTASENTRSSRSSARSSTTGASLDPAQRHHGLQIGVATHRHHPQHPQALAGLQRSRDRLNTR
jgi:hypothetical protein